MRSKLQTVCTAHGKQGRGESTNESQEFDIHGGSRRALSTPSSRAPVDDAVPRRGRPNDASTTGMY